MAVNQTPGNAEDRFNSAISGQQDYLRIWHPNPNVDATGGQQAAGITNGMRVADIPALPVGTYYAAFPLGNCASPYTHLLAAFTGGTLTTTIYSTYKDHTTLYQEFTGDGVVATGTEQIANLAAPKGEFWGIVKLVVTGSTVTFTSITRAEYNSARG